MINKVKKRIVIYIILFQILIIFIVSVQLYNKNAILGTQLSVNPIYYEKLIFPETDGLKYFYELEPNTTNVIKLAWENTNGPKYPTYKINADGLNQVKNFPSEKPKGTFRIVALGDSFTFGANVNTEDNYPSQLQRILNNECKDTKFEVLNLGVGGYDIQYAVERFKLRGQKYDPDIILWLIINDDLLRYNELLKPKFRKYYKEMQDSGEFEKQFQIDEIRAPWNRAKDEVVNEIGEAKLLEIQNGFLQVINQYFKKNLLIFTFSETEQKYKTIMQNLQNSRIGIFYYDQLPYLYSIDKAALPDKHPSPVGHNIIANKVFEYLKENKLIACNN